MTTTTWVLTTTHIHTQTITLRCVYTSAYAYIYIYPDKCIYSHVCEAHPLPRLTAIPIVPRAKQARNIREAKITVVSSCTRPFIKMCEALLRDTPEKGAAPFVLHGAVYSGVQFISHSPLDYYYCCAPTLIYCRHRHFFFCHLFVIIAQSVSSIYYYYCVLTYYTVPPPLEYILYTIIHAQIL